jgi:hypothetical protein
MPEGHRVGAVALALACPATHRARTFGNAAFSLVLLQDNLKGLLSARGRSGNRPPDQGQARRRHQYSSADAGMSMALRYTLVRRLHVLDRKRRGRSSHNFAAPGRVREVIIVVNCAQKVDPTSKWGTSKLIKFAVHNTGISTKKKCALFKYLKELMIDA